MIRRHPHVFGDVKAGSSAAVLKNWEHIKARERAAEGRAAKSDSDKVSDPSADSVLAGVPRSLPAVLEAYQLTRRASHVGFDWDSLDGVLEKLDEEKHELRAELPSRTKDGPVAKKLSPAPSSKLENEVGDLLFAAVNVARFVGVDPEIALKKANRKFTQRFHWMEAAAARNGSRFADLPRDQMEDLWNQSKASE